MDGEPVGDIDKALGPEHGMPDPLLDTGKAIPIGIGKGLTRTAVRTFAATSPRRWPATDSSSGLKSAGRARATKAIGERTRVTHVMG